MQPFVYSKNEALRKEGLVLVKLLLQSSLLNAAEQEVLLRKMEAFCQQQTGMSLHEYAQQLRDSESQTPGMQM